MSIDERDDVVATESSGADDDVTSGSVTRSEPSTDFQKVSKNVSAKESPKATTESPKKESKKSPRRWLRGGIPFVVGGFLAFCLMALERQFRWGVPVATLGLIVSVWGLLDLLGTFDDADETVAKSTRVVDLLPQFGAVVLAFVATLVFIGLAVAGWLSLWASALLITTSFLALVVCVYWFGKTLGPWATDENGEPRKLVHRHGFWVVVVGTVIFLPMLGSYSLSDPWETHYGEVAREILARNDWISTWWAQDGWFWSKPVLNFWTEALSMSLFGVGYQPDQMLAAVTQGRDPWPEWAIRMPVFIFTIVATYFIFKAIARVFGRRAGFIGAVVLTSMPHWFLIAHQTMTDLPFVAAMTTAMGLLLLGINADPEKTVRTYEIDAGITRFRVSMYHLVIGAIVLSVLPQILYLVSCNVELMLGGPWGFRPHEDVFFSGSAGNCGLPGNAECSRTLPVAKAMQPVFQALIWTVTTGLLLFLNRKERRVSRLLFLAAWFFAAISTMGKGPAGFALPMLCAGAYILVTGKWKKLLSMEFISGLLIIMSLVLPWWIAMFVRHGQAFTDRLLFHDMWKRAMVHVHDTNAGVDVSFRYFVWQLGYALFPWVGLVPAGLVWWLRRREDAAGTGRGDASVFLAMWFLFAFALFTAMLTKFHHYIFPAVPPAAMLTGILLDRMMGKQKLVKPGKGLWYAVTVGVGTVLSIYGIFRMFGGMLTGYKPMDGPPRPGSFGLGVPILLGGIAVIAAGIRMFGNTAVEGSDAPALGDKADSGLEDGSEQAKGRKQNRIFEDVVLGAMALGAAVIVGLVGYDLVSQVDSRTPGQSNLMFLFTYNYKRAWPDNLAFSGMISAFIVVAAVLMLLLVVRNWRRHVVTISLVMGLCWAAWGLDIYLAKASPHWGQREIIAAYYEARVGPEQPLVAYQMNWKGENFYTSNRIPAFVSSGKKFKDWIKEQTDNGVKTMFFVTEPSRSGGLKNELGARVVSFERVTDAKLNNKFSIYKANFEVNPNQPPDPPSPADEETDDG